MTMCSNRSVFPRVSTTTTLSPCSCSINSNWGHTRPSAINLRFPSRTVSSKLRKRSAGSPTATVVKLRPTGPTTLAGSAHVGRRKYRQEWKLRFDRARGNSAGSRAAREPRARFIAIAVLTRVDRRHGKAEGSEEGRGR
jgi:hypothetical protein